MAVTGSPTQKFITDANEFCMRTPPGRVKDFDMEFAGIDKPANIASFVKSKMYQQVYS
jgi:hypothetical protein